MTPSTKHTPGPHPLSDPEVTFGDVRTGWGHDSHGLETATRR